MPPGTTTFATFLYIMNIITGDYMGMSNHLLLSRVVKILVSY